MKDANIGNLIKTFLKAKISKQHSTEIQDNYPELGYKIFIINTGIFFKALWSLAKLLVSD